MNITHEQMQSILDELNHHINGLQGIKSSLETLMHSDGKQIQISVYDIRYLAILEEVYRRDSIVTATELSAISKKWGKDPRGSAGYFAGEYPSMKGIAGDRRALTDKGVQSVIDARNQYGNDWLDKINIDYIGDNSTPNEANVYI